MPCALLTNVAISFVPFTYIVAFETVIGFAALFIVILADVELPALTVVVAAHDTVTVVFPDATGVIAPVELFTVNTLVFPELYVFVPTVPPAAVTAAVALPLFP